MCDSLGNTAQSEPRHRIETPRNFSEYPQEIPAKPYETVHQKKRFQNLKEEEEA